jgi:hypothetical protein
MKGTAPLVPSGRTAPRTPLEHRLERHLDEQAISVRARDDGHARRDLQGLHDFEERQDRQDQKGGRPWRRKSRSRSRVRFLLARKPGRERPSRPGARRNDGVAALRPHGNSERRNISGAFGVPRIPTRPPARDDRLRNCGTFMRAVSLRGSHRPGLALRAVSAARGAPTAKSRSCGARASRRSTPTPRERRG